MDKESNAGKYGEKITKLLRDWEELNLHPIALAKHSFKLGFKEAQKEIVLKIYEDDQFWKEPLECLERYLKEVSNK